MAADIKSIAKILGVSTTTVSRALTDKGRISPKTREKVKQLAKKLDYRPNALARGLQARKSASIGVLIIDTAGSFYPKILAGIDRIAEHREYSVLLAFSGGSSEREIKRIELFREKQVDGLIIAPSDPSENVEYYRQLAAADIPFVLIDRYFPALETDCVATDNFKGGYLAGKHLASIGRKKLGFVTNISTERSNTAVVERLAGFKAAISEWGLEGPEVIGENIPDILPQEEFARQAMHKFLLSGKEIDGVFATNDYIALGVRTALWESGKKVPEDVSLVGFDDIELAPFMNPPLTTLRQKSYDIGEQAVALLFERIGSKTEGRTAKKILIRPELIIRGTSSVGIVGNKA